MQDGAYVFDNIQALVTTIQLYGEGFNDALIDAYMIPKAIISLQYDQQGQLLPEYSGQNSPITIEKNISKPTTLNGYTPKNKKLLTFPFCYIVEDNNNGTSNVLHYELFNDIELNPNKCYFKIKGVPTIGGSIKCFPVNYKSSGLNGAENEGIIGGKYPTLSWSQDEYINWLTQNAVNIGIGITSNVLQIAGGFLSGNPIVGVAGMASGANGIANILGQVYQHSLVPQSAQGNTNGGDINTCSSTNTFYFYQMSIRSEYARVIDDFFSMYGYKINNLKQPNITGRTNWNYVKTIDCNITGEIPQEDLQELKDMFDNGVTFWHNPATFLDYSQSNAIVS